MLPGVDLLSLCLLSGCPVDFAILLGPVFIPIIKYTSPWAGFLKIKHIKNHTKCMPKVEVSLRKEVDN